MSLQCVSSVCRVRHSERSDSAETAAGTLPMLRRDVFQTRKLGAMLLRGTITYMHAQTHTHACTHVRAHTHVYIRLIRVL